MVTISRACLPRIVIAGLSGDTGKSLVALGISRAMRQQGLKVAPFKKGPDFIDAAWLGVAAGNVCHNLDTFMMPAAAVCASLGRAAGTADLAVIEGNRGLFDGFDAKGSHSTAQLAKLTHSPVILVVDATKVTRTVAALVLGCQKMDPEVHLAGVILNRVGSERQRQVIEAAIIDTTGLPVLGTIRKLKTQHLPSRHLGLVTAVEHSETEAALTAVAEVVKQQVNLAALRQIGDGARPLPTFESELFAAAADRPRVRIGILQDAAFSFYYPDNLDALVAAGAELITISPLRAESLPAVDGLYVGGGFPEEHAASLSRNETLRAQLRERIKEGIPVWAECGGLIYLARSVMVRGVRYPLVGALPIDIQQTTRPQGHGYVHARVDGENPILAAGTDLWGHEFHYSHLAAESHDLTTVMDLKRGVGVGRKRDGLRHKNVVASYTHLHALGVPSWAPGMVRAAEAAARPGAGPFCQPVVSP